MARWGCSTRPRAARAAPATSTTSRRWSRWPASTPTRGPFERWLRGGLPSARRRPAASPCRPCTGSRGRSGTGWSSFGVTAGLMPHRLAVDVEEERRVLHVAITRCRRRVGRAGRRHPAVAVPGRARRLGSHDRHLVAAPPGRPPRSRRRAEHRREPVPAEAEAPRGRAAGVAPGAVTAGRGAGLRRAVGPPPAGHRRRPARPLRELRALPGIGPTKLEAYGDEILAVLEPFVGAG